jgi:hypothetical protein
MTYDFPKHIKGDTWPQSTFTVVVNDVAKDLTGASIAMKVRDCNNTVLLSLTNGAGITITVPASGKFQIDAQILDIAAGVHSYDIEITFSDGTVKTWIAGKLTVTQDKTY